MKKTYFYLIIAGMITLCCTSAADAQTGNVLYVKANATAGANNGTNWADAYINFQAAIDSAQSGDSVFVAAGTYQPASGQSFSMKEGVKIYGHFAGTELSLSERNLNSTDTTFLQGNNNSVIRNDGNGLTNAAILDGFTITGGHALNLGGGGIYNSFSSPTLSNLVIRDNNTASNLRGGGMYNWYASSILLKNVIISGNSASGTGGGIYNLGSKITFENATISSNQAQSGGGIYNDFYTTLTFTNGVISGNKASYYGGGMIISGNSTTATLTNITICGNRSGFTGGGIKNGGILTLYNTITLGNSSGIADNGISASSSHNLIQTGDDISGGSADGTGVALPNTQPATIFVNPIAPGIAPTTTGNYSLQAAAPAINAGDTAYYPGNLYTSMDLAGNPRVMGYQIDMGAYEFLGTPLSIQLTDIAAENKESFNRIYWSTAAENAGDEFILERSNSGYDFEPITMISARGFASRYTYDDKHPFLGINFYRIKTLGVEGKIQYSKIITAIVAGNKTNLALAPNPAEASINLYYNGQLSELATVQITDMLGKVVKRLSLNQNSMEIPIADLPTGVYNLHFGNGSYQQDIKFVKR